jgi:predicted DNA-binding protein (MmcQ/YjbR family)
VSLETEDALSRAEIKRLVRDARSIVIAKLPKKTQAALAE